MGPRNLINRTHGVWEHAEVVGLCSDRIAFFGFSSNLFSLGGVYNPLSRKSKCDQLLEFAQAQGRPAVRIFPDKVVKWFLGTSKINHDVWRHVEVVGLCADRIEFFHSFRLISPVLPALLTALCHSSRSGEMNEVSLSKHWS